jgi:hypothetical protein
MNMRRKTMMKLFSLLVIFLMLQSCMIINSTEVELMKIKKWSKLKMIKSKPIRSTNLGGHKLSIGVSNIRCPSFPKSTLRNYEY